MLDKRVVLLDNFDSFTYNIFQYLSLLGAKVLVFKNNEIDLKALKKLDFSHLVISPGPGSPINDSDFGVCKDAINYFYNKKPILGVCLGHQGIAAQFGAKVIHSPEVLHGTRSLVKKIGNSKLFEGIAGEFEVMRYHSLIVEKHTLPKDFIPTAETVDQGLLMAFEHKKLPVFGIQFHPESIGTPDGMNILRNFLSID
jgi:anthranilate synthase/aminodeoxychorismate synthase-like glutamine amidotransferase